MSLAEELLGRPGAMLSGSKMPPRGCEDHTIYWNACVFAKVGRKDAESIWHGDLDVTASEAKLTELARRLDQTIYVTPEQPWRWDGFRETMKRSYERERVVTFDPKKGRLAK